MRISKPKNVVHLHAEELEVVLHADVVVADLVTAFANIAADPNIVLVMAIKEQDQPEEVEEVVEDEVAVLEDPLVMPMLELEPPRRQLYSSRTYLSVLTMKVF